MTGNLLTREKEFYRMNKELDEETKELMKEIDQVTKSKESFTFKSQFPSAFDDFYAQYPLHSPREEKKNNALACDAESILSPKPDNSKNEAVIRVLQKKIEGLTTEIQTMKEELKKSTSRCRDLEAENQRISGVKDKLYHQNNSQKETIAKLDVQVNHLQGNSQEQMQENESLRKEIDSLKREAKQLSQQLHQVDLRLTRSLEETEKLRSSSRCSKIEEKELRAEIKKLKDNEKNNIRKVQRQKAEILQAFKKQILLVDNLKKQKAMLEVSRQVELTHQDLLSILNWKSVGN
ncbi:nuclear distribution protein nudE-like 1-A [Fopius arisanus]|uniref:Nuclear distribution protein nudE-like 1-A n=1 Tax=Fopius arisanus TaxID=64838 RepID=A0A0C9R0A3_9HYME|nr:PREDICTED: nuclear distribution protein nudE-like 1-A [Fopius arisanus]